MPLYFRPSALTAYPQLSQRNPLDRRKKGAERKPDSDPCFPRSFAKRAMQALIALTHSSPVSLRSSACACARGFNIRERAEWKTRPYTLSLISPKNNYVVVPLPTGWSFSKNFRSASWTGILSPCFLSNVLDALKETASTAF